jgi:hypothetical protein
VAERAVDADVRAAAAQRDHELDLVVEVIGRGREGERPATRHNSDGGLHEKERRLPVRVVAHLDRVLGVIATDAEHAQDGEDRVRAVDRQRHRRGGGYGVLHRSILPHRLTA